MPYVARDGTVGGRKPFTRMIMDFLQGVVDFVAVFFGSITNPPQRIESRSTFGNRNGGSSYRGSAPGRPSGGSNVRGLRNLGDAQARMGGTDFLGSFEVCLLILRRWNDAPYLLERMEPREPSFESVLHTNHSMNHTFLSRINGSFCSSKRVLSSSFQQEVSKFAKRKLWLLSAGVYLDRDSCSLKKNSCISILRKAWTVVSDTREFSSDLQWLKVCLASLKLEDFIEMSGGCWLACWRSGVRTACVEGCDRTSQASLVVGHSRN
eukprot:scaffold16189_cov125-Cylindrotheca_fusiformis.AAC.12